MVYRFYCMALFHSQARRHMIKVVLSDTKILCLETTFSNGIKSKEFQYPSIVFLSIVMVLFYTPGTKYIGGIYFL